MKHSQCAQGACEGLRPLFRTGPLCGSAPWAIWLAMTPAGKARCGRTSVLSILPAASRGGLPGPPRRQILDGVNRGACNRLRHPAKVAECSAAQQPGNPTAQRATRELRRETMSDSTAATGHEAREPSHDDVGCPCEKPVGEQRNDFGGVQNGSGAELMEKIEKEDIRVRSNAGLGVARPRW